MDLTDLRYWNLEDPIHKKIMSTIEMFIDEDDMRRFGALQYAISKRKFLLKAVFTTLEKKTRKRFGR